MILRSGNAASFLVEFPSGSPDGSLNWRLLGPDGSLLTQGTEIVAPSAVSATIIVPTEFNTLPDGELTSYRDLLWSYDLNGELYNDERRYTLEGRVPYGVTYDGVRTKLGVAKHDLPDEEIGLVKAYYDFATLLSPNSYPSSIDGASSLRVRDAIEATAALSLIPTMQVRIANKESSGTDTFQRQKIDWVALADHLAGIVTGGLLVIVPTFDPLAGVGAIFILAAPAVDSFTGEGASAGS